MKSAKNNPLVSIIIPVYNGEKYIKEAIDSALNQTYKNIEIIIVDDGSNDNTSNIVSEYKKRVRYFKKTNGGVYSALNFGIKKMHGEYFSWLSCDDVYFPSKVQLEVDALIESGQKDCVVFSNYNIINEYGNDVTLTHFEDSVLPKQLCAGIHPVLYGMVNGDTILIPKSIFKTCGTFDESLRTSGDYVLWAKIFQATRSIFVSEPTIAYRIHEGQDTKKSPVYKDESNSFWCSAIDQITEKDIAEWGATPFQVYMDLYRNMKLGGFDEASKKAFAKAQRYIEEKRTISVLMPAYNSEKYIAKAIDSLLLSSYGDFELLIIDDGSKDSTLAIARKYAKEDPRIKVISNEKNRGVANAMNRGLELSTGKYITRLDSDDIDGIDRLCKEYLFLETTQYGFCTTNMALTDCFGNITNQNTYPELYAPVTFAAAFTHPIPSAPTMYRSDIIKKNNIRFKEYFVAEDYDFLLSYLRYGDGAVIFDTQYYYRVHSDSLYHSNTDLAISKGYFLCAKYANSIFPNLSKTTLFNLISDFVQDKKDFSDKNILAACSEMNEIIATFRKTFNYTEVEVNNCYHFIISSLLRSNRHQQQPADEQYLPIYRRVIRSVRLDGVKKTVKKVIKKCLKTK